ncbi:MAG: DUF6444 domain-containing protein [Noviherbaspirillum sp.]
MSPSRRPGHFFCFAVIVQRGIINFLKLLHSSCHAKLPDFSTLSSQQKDELILLFFAEIQKLQQRIDSLEAQQRKDSHNSSKPPSSDGFKRKPKSMRESGKTKPGGQWGIVGQPGKGLRVPMKSRCMTCQAIAMRAAARWI